VSTTIRAVALDLFDTIVHWQPERLPRFRFREREFPSTMPILLPMLERALGAGFDADHWLETYFVVLEEIVAEREREGIEITCETRFVRALRRLELVGDAEAARLGVSLAREHMAQVRAVTSAPAENVEVVRRLARRYRLAVLSNFDDGETGRAIVGDTGVADLFETILISADLELRKPNPAIFHELLGRLELAPAEVLFVGDTPREDVAGAQSACRSPGSTTAGNPIRRTFRDRITF
jgi:HAD superfamily hydrolase (TIGR01549 family)